jgi:hypothetical protein
MRKLLLTTLVVLVAWARPARADVGIGLFLGEPTGLDLKLGLGNRSAIDLVLGYDTIRDGRTGYGHLTYLVTPLVGHGSSVTVPVRLGIGAAIFGPSGDLGFAVRAPLELGLRFHATPLELYGEIAAALELVGAGDPPFLDLQGGGGFRLFF